MFGFTNINENQGNGKSPCSLARMATDSLLKGKDINELIPYMKLPMGNIQQVSVRGEISSLMKDINFNRNYLVSVCYKIVKLLAN